MIPEIMDGKNIADFVDKDILIKLNALEKEEEMREKALELEGGNEDSEMSLDEDDQNAYREVVSKRAKLKLEHKLKLSCNNKHIHRPTMDDLKKALPKDSNFEKIEKENTKKSLKRKGRKVESVIKDLGMEMEGEDD